MVQYKVYLVRSITWILLGCLLMFADPLQAQQPEEPFPALFSYLDEGDLDLTDEQQQQLEIYQADLTNGEIDIVNVAAESLQNADGVNLNFADDQGVPLPVVRIEERTPQDVTWYGRNLDTQSEAMLVILDSKIVGTIHVEEQLYRIRPLGDGLHVVIQVNLDALPDEHPPEYEEIEQASDAQFDLLPQDAPTDSTLRDDGSVTTVLIAYTAAARMQSGNIEAFNQLAIDETNQGYINSGVNLRLQLVHSHEVNYTESNSFATDLERIISQNDGFMDEVHTHRDTYAADVVILLRSDGNYCGLASSIMAHEGNAFAVVAQPCATGYYSFGHEIGHLQGARHNPQTDTASVPFAYGHGYYIEENHWRTVMSYDCPSGCTRFSYWSNPSNLLGILPMGTAELHHNARVLNETAYTVSNFRVNQITTCIPVVRGNRSGIDDTVHSMSYDNDRSTFFKSSYNDWQFIDIDLNCVGKLSAVRRYMSHDGIDITGQRGHNTPQQGEGFAYSLDGVNWTDFTGNNTNGWESYVNYGANQQAWHTINYGWSAWLNLNIPAEVRYVRFKWDGDSDALNEIQLSFQPHCHCEPEITGNKLGDGGPAHILSYDGNTATFFRSQHDNWQYIELDFNCIGTFAAIRRYMSWDGTNTTGNRGYKVPLQGESVSYSLDGVTWMPLTDNDTNGWESYVNYGTNQQAWHTVNYGWSAWLNLNEPVQARYVRFHWDGDDDALNEIEVSLRN